MGMALFSSIDRILIWLDVHLLSPCAFLYGQLSFGILIQLFRLTFYLLPPNERAPHLGCRDESRLY
jgi:hypothetical protein